MLPHFDLKSGHHVVYGSDIIRPLKAAKLSEYRTGFRLASEMAAEHFDRRGRHRLSELVRILLRCLTRSLEGKSRDAYQRTIMDIWDLVDSAFPGSSKCAVLQRIERGFADVSVRRDRDSISVTGFHSSYIYDEMAIGNYDEIRWFNVFTSWSPSRNEGLRT